MERLAITSPNQPHPSGRSLQADSQLGSLCHIHSSRVPGYVHDRIQVGIMPNVAKKNWLSNMPGFCHMFSNGLFKVPKVYIKIVGCGCPFPQIHPSRHTCHSLLFMFISCHSLSFIFNAKYV